MFKNKEVNIAEELTEILNNINFNMPDERMKQINLKLNNILNKLNIKTI